MKTLTAILAVAICLTAAAMLFANTPGRHSVQLNWTASSTSGVTYNIYRGAATGVCAGAPTPYSSGVATTGFLDTNVQAGTYVYAVSAYSSTGGESTCSSEVQVTVPSIATFPPTNLSGVSN